MSIPLTLLNTFLELVQHHFFMMLYGVVLWFLLRFSLGKNKGTWKTWFHFWHDQKDEFVVTVCFGLGFIVWDDEFMTLVNWVFKPDEPYVLSHFYYLLIGPAVERVYKILS